MLMDHYPGALLSEEWESVNIKALSSLLLNIPSCCILGGTPQPINSKGNSSSPSAGAPMSFWWFFIHRREEDRTALHLNQNAGFDFSYNPWKCLLQNDDYKKHETTCFGRWYHNHLMASLPLGVPQSVLTTHFCFSGRLNCPSATEAGHVVSQVKEIHAHDE